MSGRSHAICVIWGIREEELKRWATSTSSIPTYPPRCLSLQERYHSSLQPLRQPTTSRSRYLTQIGIGVAALGLIVLMASLIAERIGEREADRALREDRPESPSLEE